MSELNGVDKELARKELEAMMGSRLFDRAPNMGVLFRYVCNKALDGRAEEIKEYNIAVEAFGRPPNFDKRRDSIVRVEALYSLTLLIPLLGVVLGAHHQRR